MTAPIPGTLGIIFSRVDDAAMHPLGIEIDSIDGLRRKYIRAGAAILAMEVLKIDYAEGPLDYDPTTALNDVAEGVAEVAIADNHYGWIIVGGNEIWTLMANATVAGDELGTSATQGSLTTMVIAGANPTQAEAQRVLAAASGRRFVCTIVPVGATVYGVARIC
jgi:hypothetical protein